MQLKDGVAAIAMLRYFHLLKIKLAFSFIGRDPKAAQRVSTNGATLLLQFSPRDVAVLIRVQTNEYLKVLECDVPFN